MLKVLKLRRARERAFEGSLPAMEDDLAGLVQRHQAGKKDALRTLLTALGPPMLQVVRRVLGARHPDVEDTLQEAAIALVRALPGFRGECGARHFASRIAALTAISARRRRHLTTGGAPRGPYEDDEVHAASEPETDWAVAARRRELLRHLLDELPEPQAETLVLHSITGFTVEEVARAMAVPVETARSRLRLARAALRVRIAGDPAASELLEDLP